MSESPSQKTCGLPRVAFYLFVANALARVLLALKAPVFYKEAYFWEWSRFPSLGYLDHPPLVAWIISGMGLLLPERSVLAIRLGALILGSGSFLLIYLLAKDLYDDERLASRAMVISLGLPVLSAAGVLMTPDAPLLFFHLLAVWGFVRAAKRKSLGWWMLVGIAMGLALLSKLTALLTLGSLVLVLLTISSYRRWLKRWEPYAALMLSILFLSPFLIWNAENGWISFVSQFWSRHRAGLSFEFAKVGEYLFEQAANSFILLAVPVLGVLFVPISRVRRERRDAFTFMRWQAVLVLLAYLVPGALSQTHPHWTMLAYPAASIALAGVWPEDATWVRWGLRRLTIAAIAVSLCVGVALPSGLTILAMAEPADFGAAWGRKVSLAQSRVLGWPSLIERVSAEIRKAGGDGGSLLLGYDYKQMSMFSYNWPGPPVTVLDVLIHRGLRPGCAQWYYLDKEALLGRDGFLVTDWSKATVEHLSRYFEEVEFVTEIPKQYGDVTVDNYRLFRFRNLVPVLIHFEE